MTADLAAVYLPAVGTSDQLQIDVTAPRGIVIVGPWVSAATNASSGSAAALTESDDDAMRSYVSALWAEDWDCAEDAVYDTL